MEDQVRDTLSDLERYRVQLEQNMEKLRRALQHWHTWDTEYEGLKEELAERDSDVTQEEMGHLVDSYGGKLVDENEINELFGLNKGLHRSPKEVVEVISRRQDYVQQNIQTLQKQLGQAETKLDKISIISQPNDLDDEGLPITEIREELDEDGNVISSTTFQPGNDTSNLVEALKKVGIKDRDLEATQEMSVQAAMSGTPVVNDGLTGMPPSLTVESASASSAPVDTEKAEPVAIEEVVSTHHAEPSTGEAYSQEPASAASDSLSAKLSKGSFPTGSRIVELNEHDEKVGWAPIIPPGETEEEAALRREMVEYGLNEIGQVVAELELDEIHSDDDDDDYNYYDDDEEEDLEDDVEEGEEEDKYGRSTKQQLSEGYKKRMLQLEKELNARMLENVGPRLEENELTGHTEDLRRLVVRPDNATTVNTTISTEVEHDANRRVKKGVRFADELDISTVNTPVDDRHAVGQNTVSAGTKSESSPLSSTVIERSGTMGDTISSVEQQRPKKVSRFKSSRTDRPSDSPSSTLPPPADFSVRPVPQGPTGRTLSQLVVEKQPGPQDGSLPEPDEFDPALLQREVAVGYHQARNRLIQKQGGFMPTPEEAADPLVEERDGQIKKVSRFKAAKLRTLGMQQS